MKKEKHLMVEDDIIADNDVKKEFNLSEKMKRHRITREDYCISTDDVKEFIKIAEEKSDDAGHFNHDTKVVRLKDLKELAGDKLK